MRHIPNNVLHILRGLYLRTIDYQFNENCITVRMTFDQFLSLWSDHRIAALTKKRAQGPKALKRYLTDKYNRPVVGWRSRDLRQPGGDMTVDMVRIVRAEDSRRLFQFKAGDAHSAESRKAIGDSKRGKKQSADQIAKRTAARVATMARKRAERLAAQRATQ